jgi:hypothetical protein
VLLSGDGKPGRSSQRLRRLGAATFAGGAAAEKGSPPVRSGAAGGRTPPIGKSVGGGVGQDGPGWAEAGRPCWTQAPAECGRREEDRARAETWTAGSGL